MLSKSQGATPAASPSALHWKERCTCISGAGRSSQLQHIKCATILDLARHAVHATDTAHACRISCSPDASLAGSWSRPTLPMKLTSSKSMLGSLACGGGCIAYHACTQQIVMHVRDKALCRHQC